MQQDQRPNLLIIYADQMRYDCTGAAGNSVIRTPNLDRLTSEGAFFEQAYTSFPLCCPFRASLLTGKYAHSNGMYANHYPIPLGQRWLADCFNEAGYTTSYVGKWHLNGGPKYAYVPPEYRCGFQRFLGFSRGHQYFDSIFYRDDDTTPRASKRYEPDVQTDHLCETMGEAVGQGSPFFAMVCYGPPHPPLVMPDHYASMYDPADIPIRACTPQAEREQARQFLAKYYGLCTAVDDNVGRVLDWLDEVGVADNTIVVFVSDHGEMAREFGLGGKKTYYNASMHVPFIVRWPEAIRGGQCLDAMVDPAVDLMPTLLDLCGIDTPDCVQGQSLAPLLACGDAALLRADALQRNGTRAARPGVGLPDATEQGQLHCPAHVRSPIGACRGVQLPSANACRSATCRAPTTPARAPRDEDRPLRNYVFYEILKEAEGPERFPVPERGIRTRDWLYVRRETGPTHLFDVRADPLEMTNRVGDSSFADQQRELEELLSRHMDATDDDWGKEAVFPPPNFMSHEDAPKYHAELLERVVFE